MVKLDRDPRVFELARELGLAWRTQPLNSIRLHALEVVSNCLRRYPTISSLEGLRSALCDELSVSLEFVREDDDLIKVATTYQFSDVLRKQLQREFDYEEVDGWLISNPAWRPGLRRYVAIVDARGARSSRAYFTAWHEITHLIVTPPQLAFEGFRRSIPFDKTKDPVESVVDSIAGEIAFYGPLVKPALSNLEARTGRLTFEVIEDFRRQVASAASFYSAAISVVKLTDQPALLVQVRPARKKAEQRLSSSGQMSLSLSMHAQAMLPELRAVDVIPNDPAKQIFSIFKNMRVPPGSVLSRAYTSITDIYLYEREDQNHWETSTAGHLPPLPLHAEAVRKGSYVYGLLTPDVTGMRSR